ncbi:HAD domain-containing protein [Cupriavidus metallidurans]|nr:HAD domain-containing protein [Cupriavidus metallidurans]QGS32439.1 hypothetical protein FOB83_26775 [Cupriavidus metallidurans]
MTTMPTLYLAFDGVLHPNLVSFHGGCAPRLRAGGHTLFENNTILEQLMDACPSTVVVLHNWWVQIVGYQGTLRLLPESVRSHVIGSTWRECRGPRARVTNNRSRRDWLQNDLVRRQPEHPVLVDCDARQVVPQLLDSACIVDNWRGLTEPGAWERLVTLLTTRPEQTQISGYSLDPRHLKERVAA